MDRFQRYGNLLRNDGTNQLQRLSPALEPDYILPDERSLSDLLTYARDLATQIRFYSLTGQSTGDWRPFLEALMADVTTGTIHDTATLETLLQTRQDWPPHLALFIVFLKLFQTLQSDLNELPQRHLRHYYEQELYLLRRSAQADAVHVIFELARNAAPTLIPAGTLLDAGKDSEGRPLYYATTSDRVINAAQVSDIRRLVGEQDRFKFRRFFTADTLSELEGESWYTFGRSQLDLDPSQRFMTEVQMGFAIAAPILRLAEGWRQITVQAQLRTERQQPVPQGLSQAFVIDLTGAEGWLTPDTVTAQLINRSPEQPLVLEITLTLEATAPAVVAFDSDLHGQGPVSAWPLIRCRLNNSLGYYDTLAGLVVEQVTLAVDVTGVSNLVVQNSQRLLSSDQPMPLFGNQPSLGSPFYIGSAEIFSKQLTSLNIHLTWQDLPDNLFEHYRAYFDAVSNNLENQFSTFFLVRVEQLYDNSWEYTLKPSAFLFDYLDPNTPQAITITPEELRRVFADVSYEAQPSLSDITAYSAQVKTGFIRLVLLGAQRTATNTSFEAFGHRLFPTRYARQAIALSRHPETATEPEPELPNEPITPTLSSLSLDYSAAAEMVPGDRHSPETFFRLEPFGYAVADRNTARVVPELEGDVATHRAATGATDASTATEFHLGALYIGLANFVAPGNIALLFQMAQGTATASETLKENETVWSYLRGDTWQDLARTAVLNDSTSGFQEPGIVVLAIGRDASVEHTLMPSGQVWLRALIRKSPTSAARLTTLRTQAVTATLAPTVDPISDYNDHLSTQLNAATIQRLKQRLAPIKTVEQPAPSFGGRTSETDTDFFRRCSERLRHRNRAITIWDFERLVLEAFPEIFKVKCLPHSDQYGQDQPGDIAIVVVPDVRAVPTLEPRAGEVLIQRIKAYLDTDLATPFANIHVTHPTYERIRVDARVSFRQGLDAGYYAGVLNEDLRRFLSPWAYEDGEDIVFGGQIYRSEILAFIEGRDYVDYITDFNLYHNHDGPAVDGISAMAINLDFFIRPDPQPAIATTADGMTIGDTFVVGQGVEVATATQAQTILVSHPEHRIVPVTPASDDCDGVETLGIGYMAIRLDFEITASSLMEL
ncbi:MAG: hypothetical protein F6K00_18790 [Leptolyngbya sp. SIOISBB]|nr:hypothetical protein [Leptolyngbya sp. SIOISBB]